jgi:hypothetical protein
MYITRKDIEKILEIIDKFPDATSYRLQNENQSGIGSIYNLIIDTNINNTDVEVKVEISGVEDW